MNDLIKYTGIGAVVLLPTFLLLWFAPIVAAAIAGLFGFALISLFVGMILHGAWEQFFQDWWKR